MTMILNGVPWFDDQGNIVNAHGSCIMQANGRWYLFGEYKTDDENTFIGFSCYSSDDLEHWHFERLALPLQREGRLGPNRVGERVKVLRCPATGKYMMYAHSDDMKYCDPMTIVAQSDTIDGEYSVIGPLTCDGEPIRLWDLGSFQDIDGTGYLMFNGGRIYRLSEDYLTTTLIQPNDLKPYGESPAIARVGNTYYLFMSNLTSWDRNDNFYLTAPEPAGPWTYQGLFAPEGTCTWESQSSFIFPLETEYGTELVYTGDRWSFPHQGTAATTVWMPLQFKDGRAFLPQYLPAWDSRTGKGVKLDGRHIALDGYSNQEGDVFSAVFSVPNDRSAHRLAILGHRGHDCGYARAAITPISHGNDATPIADHRFDTYSTAPAECPLYVSPELDPGDYNVTITVSGETGLWFNKAGKRYGGTDTYINVHGAVLI